MTQSTLGHNQFLRRQLLALTTSSMEYAKEIVEYAKVVTDLMSKNEELVKENAKLKAKVDRLKTAINELKSTAGPSGVSEPKRRKMSCKEGLLLGCGNQLLQISLVVDTGFLAKYDMQPNYAILAEEKHCMYNRCMYTELVDKYDATFTAEGSVQNLLRVAQWILQKPNVAVFFGSVGRDEYSKILENKACSDGVNVRYQYNETQRTGTCGVLITGDHRSLCTNLAAANCFTIDHINLKENRKYLDNAKYFYISGFFLTVSPPSIQAVAKHALKRRNLFMMNLNAPFLSQQFKKPLMDAMPNVDILFGNDIKYIKYPEYSMKL